MTTLTQGFPPPGSATKRTNTAASINRNKQRLAIAEANNEPCYRCGKPIDYTLDRRTRWGATADHIQPLAHGGAEVVALELLAPAHMVCNSRHGSRIGHAIRWGKARNVTESDRGGRPGFFQPPSSTLMPVGNLSPIALVRPDWLPSVMIPPTGESPFPGNAVGSYGPEFCRWVEANLGEAPRPWQAYVAARVLEHDDSGELVHRRVGISVPRQVGKSVLLRMLAAWRIHQGRLFGERQTVLHVAHALNTTEEVFVPALEWARRRGMAARVANGQMRIETSDGSRWLPRSTQTGYGFTLSLALVDEAWAVAPRRVNSGYAPTLSERQSGQVVMFSSANEEATPLFPKFRESAMARPGWLLVEWSAPAGVDAWDREVWQQVTPVQVDPVRAALMVDELLSDERTFRSERLNEWPDLAASSVWLASWPDLRGVRPASWEWAGVEAAYGHPPVVAWAGRDGGRVVVSVVQAGSTAEAAALVRTAGVPAVVGKSLLADPSWDDLDTRPGTATSARAVTDFRRLVDDDLLRHDGGELLAGQVAGCRVDYGPAGARVASEGRVDALKAATWAAAACRADVPAVIW